MKLPLLLVFSLGILSYTSGQNTAYFQQKVDFDIEVSLQPASHTLQVQGSFTYHNHSPQKLDSLPIHLWANAYSYRESPLAQQLRRTGDVSLAFASDADLGGYTNLTFKSDDLKAVRYDNPELAWLRLASSLQPDDSVSIAFTYQLKVPRTFSRIGRNNLDYQITQWYPKPAVFDKNGWHTMPYLNLGEFFNDFGNYNVRITVPQNGIVAATGQLINPDAITAREARIANPSASDTLTYAEGSQVFHYQATNVTDFAWFASPRFRVGVDTAHLSGGPIPSYVYYHAKQATLWQNAATYLARAAVFADSLIGPYPYPKIAAVSAPLGVGGGMEYPMITVINNMPDAKSLDNVLAHEAFHNWFQGMLATDERKHAWMDEGLTSWLEGRYMEKYYGGNSLLEGMPGWMTGLPGARDAGLFHQLFAKTKRHPKPNAAPDSLTELQYNYTAYTQPNLLFSQLESSLGKAEFENRLQDYYQRWAMKHPTPAHLQESLGGAEVAWLFDKMLLDNQTPDYSIESVTIEDGQLTVVIANEGSVPSPFPLSFQLQDDSYTTPVWYAGFSESQTLNLKIPGEAARLAIDPFLETAEVDRNDNYYRVTPGLAPKLEPIQLGLLTRIGRPDRNALNVLPVITQSASNGIMLGLGLHNYTLLTGPTRFYVSPQVSVRNATLNGMAGIRHSFYANKTWWRELEFAALGRQYNYFHNEPYDQTDRFQRGTLGARLYFKAAPGVRRDLSIGARAHLVAQLFTVGQNIETRAFTKERRSYQIYEADFTAERRDPINPAIVSLDLQAAKGFARISSTAHLGWRYSEANHFVRTRLFGGYFLMHDSPEVPAFFLANGISGFRQNQYDYTFEQFIYDRSDADNSSQVFVRDGSLTLPFRLPTLGSRDWMLSASVTADLPIKLSVVSVQAYGDIAIFQDEIFNPGETLTPFTGGLRLALPFEFFDISFPLFNSAFVKESLVFTKVDAKYTERIAYRLRLDLLDLDDLLRHLRG